MRLFKRKQPDEKIKRMPDDAVCAPVTGEMIPASNIADPVFSTECMGQTIGFEPSNDTVVVPVNGTVTALFPSGHAFGVTTKEGNGFLVHIGIDTVNLQGKGFHPYIKQGDFVYAGQTAVKVDADFIRKQGYSMTTMLVVTEKAVDDYKVDYIDCGPVVSGQRINR
ncbi:PTS sugar transporter subunit IIA [Merdibacter massiliensis]|uniref:PTS sugar transporter subunit IIA n=1 Tax=Merdibacter massiliensis TaxID=1871030 RepID=UPI0009F9B9B4|nr:PTS glucose transporter subunit IIA [Merdibacter massiliensis]